MSCATVWSERYETLRRYILQGQQLFQTQPLGLALWLRQGMAGWMQQWSQLTQASAPPLPAMVPPRSLAAGPWQQQLTMLLAQMTLAHLPSPVSL